MNEIQFNNRRPPLPPITQNTQGGGNPLKKSDPEIEKAAREFESLFMHQLLKEMRNSLDKSSDILGGGFGSETARDMLDGELANHVSRVRGIGLADLLAQEMARSTNKQAENSR